MPYNSDTANAGKAVATRVGGNIRKIRTGNGMTQVQLAAPEFSISYISAIERGKIRPSLRTLTILARRLDVPLTILLEGSPAQAVETRTIGYALVDAGPDQTIDVTLLQANILIRQGEMKQAGELLASIAPKRITTGQSYQLFLLRGQIHLADGDYQEAVDDLRKAMTHGEELHDVDLIERVRDLLGKAYFNLSKYELAQENHSHCLNAITNHRITDPLFALEVLNDIASDYSRLNDIEQAISYYHRAIDALDTISRDSRSFAQQYMDISQQYKAAGKFTMARDYAMRSLALYQMREEHKLIGITHQRLGKALEWQSLFDEAEAEYRRAIAIELELQDAVAISTCQTSLAELLFKRGRADEAEQEAKSALTYARESGDAQAQGQALFTLAQLRHQLNDFVAADDLFAQALAMLDSSHAHDIAASAYSHFANLLEERGEIQLSLKALKQAYEHQRIGK
jgi:tetratricopeptide (TPR) repeat protein